MTPGAERAASSPAPRSADVARLAGVSRKTVSRVLNNEPYVSAEARGRVLAAAEELGYRLNHAARALASGRTRSRSGIGLARRKQKTSTSSPSTAPAAPQSASRPTGNSFQPFG